MDYIPKHFEPYELIPKETYRILDRRNELYKVWWLFDPRILMTADRIWEHYSSVSNKLVCNTWWWGGKSHYRGWRPPGCSTGAEHSQHRFGRALDLIPTKVSVEEIRQEIKAGESFGSITCIEDDISWLHIDCRNYQGLLIVHP